MKKSTLPAAEDLDEVVVVHADDHPVRLVHDEDAHVINGHHHVVTGQARTRDLKGLEQSREVHGPTPGGSDYKVLLGLGRGGTEKTYFLDQTFFYFVYTCT